MAAPARARRRAAAGPVIQQPPSDASAELILSFAALEAQLSSIAQRGLAGEALESVRSRNNLRREARLLVESFRLDYRSRIVLVLESAYGSGARLAGARPPGAIQRAAIAELVHGAAVDLSLARPHLPARAIAVSAPEVNLPPSPTGERRAASRAPRKPSPSRRPDHSTPKRAKAAKGRDGRGAVARLDGALDTVGRQVDDIFRQVGLKHAARQLSRELPKEAAVGLMRQELAEHGVTAFVDKAKRRWTLSNYSRMVLRTTTSEAANRGAIDAVKATGRDLVRINLPEGVRGCGHHKKQLDQSPCVELEGKTLSLTGRTDGYPILEFPPPFHPNCQHFVAPAPELSR